MFWSSNAGVIDLKRKQQRAALDLAISATATSVSDQERFLKATGAVYLASFSERVKKVDKAALSAPEILEHIKKGEWSASDVLEAYIARAAVAHSKTNCLTEGAPSSSSRKR